MARADLSTELVGEAPVSYPVFIVVMGVSGTGKSTLGSALALALDMPYVEGDDLHSQANVDKMAAGHPLSDADREPWLQLIRTTAEQIIIEQQAEDPSGRNRVHGVVISCSALKIYYRNILRGKVNPARKDTQRLPGHLESAHPDVLPTYFVFIEGKKEVLMDRMTKRSGHFMKASMLEGQLDTLENPAGEVGVVAISLDDSTEEQVKEAKESLLRMIDSSHLAEKQSTDPE